ncbi:hypothetical protein BGZ51_000078 [Haplosporangium sp. Z 767]|nr:hypothetical protein BGZ51_000078 [Haplosporangium sp. Z 767]
MPTPASPLGTIDRGHDEPPGPSTDHLHHPQLQQKHTPSHHATPIHLLTPIPTHVPAVPKGNSTSSTTTTFYSGVKLAPLVQSATVHHVERRGPDQKAWYSIRVYPYDLTIPSSTSGAVSTSSAASAPKKTTSIPRKPYTIYRRYEDVADFADQLEEEFSSLLQAPAAQSHQQQILQQRRDLKDMNATLDHDIFLTGTAALTSAAADQTNSTPTLAPASASTRLLSLPRLKSGLVLFITKAVCHQRRDELNRYFHDLFALGHVIVRSRLVAEFFGIWKTDMEIRLRQKDRDPLALHTLHPIHPAAFATAPTRTLSPNPMAIKSESESHKGETEDEDEDEEQMKDKETEPEESKASVPLTTDTNSDIDSNSHIQATTSCSAFPFSYYSSTPSSPSLRALTPLSTVKKTDSMVSISTTASFYSSHSSFSFTYPLSASSSATTMVTPSHSSSHLTSPSLTPSLSMDSSRHPDWTLDSLVSDTEMVSPTKAIALSSTLSEPILSSCVHAHNSSCISPRHPMDECDFGSATEPESVSNDITTRTIKKFKSLRRVHTSAGHRTRQNHHEDHPPQSVPLLELPPTPTSKLNGNLTKAGSSPLTNPSTTQVQSFTKSKIMKRSKTIVFRPEVTMQPLSSKNVIPPWNRIPSVTSSAATTVSSTAVASTLNSPISPVSPTTPSGANHLRNPALSSSCSPNSIVGESVTATTPTTIDSEDRPRKLTLTHSKTMPTITTAPSLSLWGTDSSSNSPTSTTASNSSFGGALTSAFSLDSPSNGSASVHNSFRSLLTSSYSATTLIAPWNRVNPNAEKNTHLHSLIKISGQVSPSLQSAPPSNSPFVPVELGRSFLKKDGSQAQTQQPQKNSKERSFVPLLTQPPEARNSSKGMFFSGSAMRNKSKSEAAPVMGMTHSVSAPGAFSHARTASFSSYSQPMDGSSKTLTTALKKRLPRRESTSQQSPSPSTKQPVGILKNAQQGGSNTCINGARKGSLTVPGQGMFPIHPPGSSSITTFGPLRQQQQQQHHHDSIVTTFKIVVDADTIVALQVLEDRKFVLTLQDLRSRVKNKLLKSNIQLPEQFDLIWTAASSGSASIASAASSAPSSSTQQPSDSSITLRTDEDLHRAVHTSKNHKVTLRCAP